MKTCIFYLRLHYNPDLLSAVDFDNQGFRKSYMPQILILEKGFGS